MEIIRTNPKYVYLLRQVVLTITDISDVGDLQYNADTNSDKGQSPAEQTISGISSSSLFVSQRGVESL